MDRLDLGGRRGHVIAFAFAGNVVPVAIATASDFGSHGALFFVGALGACLAPLVVTAVGRTHPVPFYLAAYGGLPAMTLLQAHEGGVGSGNSLLLMMAMVWFGLQATDRELLAGVAALAACSYLPMVLVGPPAYPVDWGHATLLVIIGMSVSGSLRTLVRDMRALAAQLEREAVHDELTGLLNRRGWGQAASQQLPRAARGDQAVGVAVIDLDGLKSLNDRMGHAEGDRLLRATADRMRTAFRAGDILARLGGDEFAALLVDSSEGVAAVERLRALTPPTDRFSAGVAIWDGMESLDELVRRADVALYAVKAAGGGGVEVVDAPQALAS